MLPCRACDVVTINVPLHKDTDGLFNKELISKMKPGSYLVNTARGRIADRDAVVEALESGHLAGKYINISLIMNNEKLLPLNSKNATS
jgi:lactate dehydrogenase-like 2-hydroxyacid dehydrogenase